MSSGIAAVSLTCSMPSAHCSRTSCRCSPAAARRVGSREPLPRARWRLERGVGPRLRPTRRRPRLPVAEGEPPSAAPRQLCALSQPRGGLWEYNTNDTKTPPRSLRLPGLISEFPAGNPCPIPSPSSSRRDAAALAASADYLEALYGECLLRPDSVDPAWRASLLGAAAQGCAANEKQAAGRPPGADLRQSRSPYCPDRSARAAAAPASPRAPHTETSCGLTAPISIPSSMPASRTDWIPKQATLREIITQLEHVYYHPMSARLCLDTDERLWLDQLQLNTCSSASRRATQYSR